MSSAKTEIDTRKPPSRADWIRRVSCIVLCEGPAHADTADGAFVEPHSGSYVIWLLALLHGRCVSFRSKHS